MKYTTTRLVAFIGAIAAFAPLTLSAQTPNRPSAPTIITYPAVPNGSNASRAPFPAARHNDDVTPPNGMAFDQAVPPNTPSTTPEPFPLPAAAVAIAQPRVAPGLEPTGRPATGAAVALDATRIEPTIRSATFENRDEVISDLDSRVRSSRTAMAEFRRTESEMSTEGRAQFQSAADDVRAKEKALEKSLKAARHASAAEWDTARAQLAADYDAYAAALARVDATAGIAPAQR
jgi:hypothetical protein